MSNKRVWIMVLAVLTVFTLGVGWSVNTYLIDKRVEQASERLVLLGTLRLDAMWSAGVAAEWQWTESRTVKLSVSYMGLDDAPVTTPEIPGVGSLEGEFKSRDTILFQVGMTWGAL